ncbi:predicted protein [Sclerotinia sclerotiorum 1980 UF-70]|uniref:Uncharacterized protein n=1 Tax=Sclerotinia sclerotiorum (strain ATCC 18683 / 1980 / Ss-1) TaxID=665079 RepID=A7E6Q2_SCLS1|nr:predicted protein [Sclerotinia sclerotiorum 1980 UF-70]EDN91574.1 predicted protein [Sclerotinia sclerotiorum 1980 UF-70]
MHEREREVGAVCDPNNKEQVEAPKVESPRGAKSHPGSQVEF